MSRLNMKGLQFLAGLRTDRILVIFLFLLLSACGGGGSDDTDFIKTNTLAQNPAHTSTSVANHAVDSVIETTKSSTTNESHPTTGNTAVNGEATHTTNASSETDSLNTPDTATDATTSKPLTDPVIDIWQPYVFKDPSVYVARCANPRGLDPVSHLPYPDKQGSVIDENNWLRSMSNEYYLWYDEIDDKDPADFSTTDYFSILKTFQTTDTGRLKDRFHFSYPTRTWTQYSETGVNIGYGVTWSLLRTTPPREIVVSYTMPNSPASEEGVEIKRGMRLVKIDGIDLINSNDDTEIAQLNAALFPEEKGVTHSFTVENILSSELRTVQMRASSIISKPVNRVTTIETDTGKVGYLSFIDHIATAENELITAINQLKTENISDLVLDLRYNQGGFLDIASELSYMIVGDSLTTNQIFEKIQLNDKHPDINPVTNKPIEATPFYSRALGYSAPNGQRLPTLGLDRVFVITGDDTCSASEAIINSLRGVDVEVIQIGATTCGKPYGFYPVDNCGTTYFSINFISQNAKGFGDYADGFSPANGQSLTQSRLPGCSADDDFSHQLGDPDENRLATALAFRKQEVCPQQLSYIRAKTTKSVNKRSVVTPKAEWLSNRIIRID